MANPGVLLPASAEHTFVCYAREDSEFIQALITDLRARAVQVFVDTDISAGADWDQTIDERLRACANLLIVMSPAAVASAEVRGELRAALNLSKPIVPLLLRTCEIPRQLQNIQYLDFRAAHDTVAMRDRLAAALLSRKPSGEPTRSGPFDLAGRELRNRREFLDDLKAEAAGRLAQSLPFAMLNVMKQKEPEQVTRRWDADVRMSHQEAATLPADATIVDLFDDPLVEGKLLILGAPGSGKTTMLLELSQELLRRAELAPNAPMPVLCSLSSWRGGGQTLAAWLVERLKVKYGVRKDYGETWLNERVLVPLLDGLDEVSPEHQADCVQAINQFQQEYRPPQIVVCCRLAEYENAQLKLQLNGAIRLLPLVDEQIRQYLANADATALWTGISGDQETLALARTPLLLRLLTVACAQSPSGDWQRAAPVSQRRAHLFEIYIQRALAEAGGSDRGFPKSQTVHWLAWLARATKDYAQSELLIEHLQPTWLETAWPRLFYRAGVLTIVAAAFVLAVLLGLRVFDRIPRGAIGTAYVKLLESTPSGTLWRRQDALVVVLMGVAAGVMVARRTTIKPIETLVWSWDKGWHGLISSLRRTSVSGLNYLAYVGVVVGLVAGFIAVRSTWNVAVLSPTVLRFREFGNNLAVLNQLLFAAALGRVLRPGAWLVGGDVQRRGSAADAIVSGVVFAVGAGLNLGLLIGVLAGLCLSGLVWLSGGTRLMSAARLADALSIGMVSGFGTGVFLWATGIVRAGFRGTVGVWTLTGVGAAATTALAIGLAGGFRTVGTSPTRTTAECVRQTTRACFIGVIVAAVCVLVVSAARYAGWLVLVGGIGAAGFPLGAAWATGLAFAIWMGVVGGAAGILSGGFLGALFGVLGGLSGPDIERRTVPNQGIRQSAKNMGVFAAIGALLVGVPYGLFNLGIGAAITGVGPSAADWVNLMAGPSVLFGLLGALVPGAACVQHYTLRCVLWCIGVAPWHYARFLNYATERMLLQRVGGRYRFIHDLLREHFAAEYPPSAR